MHCPPPRLWICALILSLLGQLVWAASMPVLTDSAAAAPMAHSAHEVAPASHTPTLDEHCDATSGSSDHGHTTGHACCPLLGLEPVTMLRVAIAPHPPYEPAIAHQPLGEVIDAIFKPPKTRL